MNKVDVSIEAIIKNVPNELDKFRQEIDKNIKTERIVKFIIENDSEINDKIKELSEKVNFEYKYLLNYVVEKYISYFKYDYIEAELFEIVNLISDKKNNDNRIKELIELNFKD